MSVDKLLPCPFCGCEAEYTETSGDYTNSVNCTNVLCYAEIAGAFLEDPATIILWNTRAQTGGDLMAYQDYIRKLEGYLVAFIGLIVISDELGLAIKKTLEAGCSESAGGS